MVCGLAFVVLILVLQMLQVGLIQRFTKFCMSHKILFHLNRLKMYGSPMYEKSH